MIRKFIEWLLRGFQPASPLPPETIAPGVAVTNPKAIPPSEKTVAPPRPDVAIVSTEMRSPDPYRSYIDAQMRVLLTMIRQGESAEDYNAVYGAKRGAYSLINMVFRAAYALGLARVKAGQPSSALGAYQFISKTLVSLQTSLKLTGGETFGVLLQDDLAVALMVRRGLDEYRKGAIGVTQFCNQLAEEWASLPVVSSIVGSKGFFLTPGQSYYSGDGLNKALHDTKSFVAAVSGLTKETAK